MNLSDLSRELLEQYYRDSLNINATLRSEIESVKRVANDLAQENQCLKSENNALAEYAKAFSLKSQAVGLVNIKGCLS